MMSKVIGDDSRAAASGKEATPGTSELEVKQHYVMYDKDITLSGALGMMKKYSSTLRDVPEALSVQHNSSDKLVVCPRAQDKGDTPKRQSKRTKFGRMNKSRNTAVPKTIVPAGVEITFGDYQDAARARDIFAEAISDVCGLSQDSRSSKMEAMATKITGPYPDNPDDGKHMFYNILIDSKSFMKLVDRYVSKHCSNIRELLEQKGEDVVISR